MLPYIAYMDPMGFNIALEAMALIEIDGLPINSMVDLFMANC